MYPFRICSWNETHSTKNNTTQNYVTDKQSNIAARNTTYKDDLAKTTARDVAYIMKEIKRDQIYRRYKDIK